MRIAHINGFDMDNGPGVRVSLWTQGCPHRCKGCHNPHTWAYDGGEEWNKDELVSHLLLLLDKSGMSKDLSILGGEPFLQYSELKYILKEIKAKRPNTDIWIWTGFTLEELGDIQDIEADILVTGPYIQDLHCKSKYFGSSNQQVIHLKELSEDV